MKTASRVKEERRERGVKPVNRVSMEPPDLLAKLACPEEPEEMDTDAASSSRSTVRTVGFQRVPKTPTTSGTDSATKATLPPMPTALVFLVSVFYVHLRTLIQDGRHPDPPVARAMMLFAELPPHWTKQLPGRWYLDVASARWREVC